MRVSMEIVLFWHFFSQLAAFGDTTADQKGQWQRVGRQVGNSTDNRTDIHIIGFFPCTDPDDNRGIPVDNCDGIERIPIMKLALEEINERCDLLPGYRLVVDYANSNCSSIPATYHLIQQTDQSQPPKLMILGPACSIANEVMGEIAGKHLNITQVSYTASSSVFADTTRYPGFFRLLPIAEKFADGFAAVIQELNWKRVAVIAYIDEFMVKLKNHTVEVLKENDVNVILDMTYANDTLDLISEHIEQVNARVIIAWLPPSPNSTVTKFWCMIVKSKIFGAQFVWMFPGWFKPNWWKDVMDTDCSVDEIRNALNYSLEVKGNDQLTDDSSRILVSKKNVSEYLKAYEKLNMADPITGLDVLLSVGYVYDAVWTIALALNSSISILEERGLGRLEDFTYGSVEMADVFVEAVANVSFQGVSGNVSFEDGNRTNASLQIVQYLNDNQTVKIIYDPSNSSKLNTLMLEWKDGKVPSDGPVPVVLTNTLAEYIILGVVSLIGIISTIFFFVFNLCYSNHIVVKRSSYRLNSLIIIGVFIGYIGDLLYIVRLDRDMAETLTTTVCNARVWTNELAFMLAFGTLFVKIWRLYRLFFNINLAKRKYLHDKYLLIMVALTVAPTLLLLIIQVATYPLQLQVNEVTDKDMHSVKEIYLSCEGQNGYIFLAIYHTQRGLLVFLTVLVAYQTQKYIPKVKKYRKYHESAVINLTTIFAVLLSSVCQAVLIIFQLNRVQEGVLLIITLRDCLWMCPMIYLLFVPKVYRVYSYSIPQQLSRVNSLVLSRRGSTSFTRYSASSTSGRRYSASFTSGRRHSASFTSGRRHSAPFISSRRTQSLDKLSVNNECIRESNSNELTLAISPPSHHDQLAEWSTSFISGRRAQSLDRLSVNCVHIKGSNSSELTLDIETSHELGLNEISKTPLLSKNEETRSTIITSFKCTEV